MTSSLKRAAGHVRGVGVIAPAVLALLLAPPAFGGIASFPVTQAERGTVATFSYQAASNEKNHVEVFLDWSQDGSTIEPDEPVPYRSPEAFILSDRAGVTAGSGCTALAGANAGSVRCPFPDAVRALGPELRLGDRNDRAEVDIVGPGIRASGGGGDDRISAEGRVDGGPGNDRIGGGGRVFGGPGNDWIRGADGRDVVDGGPGHDVIAGYGSDSSVGSRRDTLAGGSGNDYMAGRGKLSGGPGNDHVGGGGTLLGGPGDDTIGSDFFGLRTDLSIESTRANIFGGPGRDTITGSEFRDVIVPGRGDDTVLAEGGNDVVRSRDRSTDLIECSSGRDSALIDGLDFAVPDCERLDRRGAARAVPTEATVDQEFSSFALSVDCPQDGPAVCVAQVTFAIRGGARRAYTLRIPRGRYRYPDFRIKPRTVLYYSSRQARTIRVTVRSKDRRGRPQVATRVLPVDFEPDDSCPGGDCDG